MKKVIHAILRLFKKTPFPPETNEITTQSYYGEWQEDSFVDTFPDKITSKDGSVFKKKNVVRGSATYERNSSR